MNNFILITFLQASVMPLILGLLWCFHCPPVVLMKRPICLSKTNVLYSSIHSLFNITIKHLQYAEPQVRYHQGYLHRQEQPGSLTKREPCNRQYSVEQWFSLLSMYQSHLEDLLDHRLLGHISKVSNSESLWQCLRICILMSSQVMLMLMVWQKQLA